MTEIFDEIETFLKDNREKEPLLTDKEYERIVISFLTTRGEEGADEEMILKVVKLCEGIVVGYTVLGMVLKGLLDIGIEKDELTFTLSEEGREYWEATK